MKRLLRDNVDVDGSIQNSRFINAMLTYKNTPCRDLGMSPAEIVLGRNVTDFFPDVVRDGLMNLNTPWREKLLYREAALSTRRSNDKSKWQEHTKKLSSLDIGDHVMIQNCHGNSPKKWEKTGVVVSIEGYDKYGIRTDGSRRLTFRNRKHLRKFTPLYPDPDIPHRVTNDRLETNETVNMNSRNSSFNAHVDKPLHNLPDPVTDAPTGKLYDNVRIYDNLNQNVNMHVPNNVPSNETNDVLENNLSEKDQVDPVVTNCEPDQGKSEKINTPTVRRSSRGNKGINDTLRKDYEVYNMNYCYACKCKLGASASKNSHFVRFGGGDS